MIDNVSRHKRVGVRKAIEEVGARLLLPPPYSPDLNPIELAFSKRKSLLRKYGERTIEGLWKRLGQLPDHFSAQECRNLMAHCGCVATSNGKADQVVWVV